MTATWRTSSGPCLVTFIKTRRYEKAIVDGQREYQDDTIGPVRAQKQNQSGQNDPRPADCFREAPYLAERRQSGLGIHAEQRKQHSPGWKNDCKQPQVYLNR